MTIRVPVREADLDLLVAGVCNIRDLSPIGSGGNYVSPLKNIAHLNRFLLTNSTLKVDQGF